MGFEQGPPDALTARMTVAACAGPQLLLPHRPARARRTHDPGAGPRPCMLTAALLTLITVALIPLTLITVDPHR